MLFTDTNNDELSADTEGPEAGSGLDDSLLDEMTDDDELSDTDEGFGHLPEPDDGEEEKETKDDEEDEEDDLLEEEEDAEDVDYDTFDDIDEM